MGGKAMHELDYSSRSLMQLCTTRHPLLHPARIPDSIRTATLRAAYGSPGVTRKQLRRHLSPSEDASPSHWILLMDQRIWTSLWAYWLELLIQQLVRLPHPQTCTTNIYNMNR